eukprot:PITA_26258
MHLVFGALVFDCYFTRLGFIKSEVDANLYHIVVEGKLLIIVLYVDDLILTGDEKLVKYCKEDLLREFEMKDVGLMHYFLVMEVCQRDEDLIVSQGQYANEILKKFHMERSKPMETPLTRNWRKKDATAGEVVEDTIYKQLMGSLIYLVNTHLDICFAVNKLSQAMVNPTKLFWKAVKHVLRYLRGTTQFGLWYKRTKEVKLKHRSVALSLAKAEYMVVSQATYEAIWMRKILVGMFDQQMDPTMIYCDNQISIKSSKNPIFHDRSKHIDIWYHHLRYCV